MQEVKAGAKLRGLGEKEMVLFAAAKVVEGFSLTVNPRKGGGDGTTRNWGSNRIEFANFGGGLVLNGIARSCCSTRPI